MDREKREMVLEKWEELAAARTDPFTPPEEIKRARESLFTLIKNAALLAVKEHQDTKSPFGIPVLAKMWRTALDQVRQEVANDPQAELF